MFTFPIAGIEAPIFLLVLLGFTVGMVGGFVGVGVVGGPVFAGPDMQMLYVTAGDKVFRRHLRRKGTVSWMPVKPPTPQL